MNAILNLFKTPSPEFYNEILKGNTNSSMNSDLLKQFYLKDLVLDKVSGGLFEAVSKALTTSIISAETIKKKTNEKLRLIVQSELFPLEIRIFKENRSLLENYMQNQEDPCFDYINLYLMALVFSLKINLFHLDEQKTLKETPIFCENFEKTIFLFQDEKLHFDILSTKQQAQTKIFAFKLINEIINDNVLNDATNCSTSYSEHNSIQFNIQENEQQHQQQQFQNKQNQVQSQNQLSKIITQSSQKLNNIQYPQIYPQYEKLLQQINNSAVQNNKNIQLLSSSNQTQSLNNNITFNDCFNYTDVGNNLNSSSSFFLNSTPQFSTNGTTINATNSNINNNFDANSISQKYNNSKFLNNNQQLQQSVINNQQQEEKSDMVMNFQKQLSLNSFTKFTNSQNQLNQQSEQQLIYNNNSQPQDYFSHKTLAQSPIKLNHNSDFLTEFINENQLTNNNNNTNNQMQQRSISSPLLSQQSSQFVQQLDTQRKPLILGEEAQRQTGTLKYFDLKKNYGFIVLDSENTEIFFHFDDIKSPSLTKDTLLSFKSGNIIRLSFICMTYIGKYNKSRKAINIQLVENKQLEQSQPQQLQKQQQQFQFQNQYNNANGSATINNLNLQQNLMYF